MRENHLIVVALGGNAISRPDEEGNVEQQFNNSARTAVVLADLIEQGHQLVITHGNGPQIGNFLVRNEAAAGLIYPLPMEVAVAHVQGGMGYMIAQTLINELARRNRSRTVTSIITTVLVDRSDPSFRNPTKPIGRTFDEKEAERLMKEEGWQIKQIAPGKFRRVVASPFPKRILEIDVIRRLVQAGELLVACGGGGIPVAFDAQSRLGGVRAVIDKDLASALLASQLDAERLMILTNVEKVMINFGKPDERAVEKMSVAQAKQWLAQGQFAAGSMSPKVQGAVDFLETSARPDACVVIGPLDHAADAIAGRTGTAITRR